MKRNKLLSKRFVWLLLVVAVLVVAYFLLPNTSTQMVTPAPVTPTPAVLSGVAPTVSIGHPTKTTGCESNGVLPDSECTPGAIDPAVTQQNINETICVSGYSSKVRPPVSETNKIKKIQLLAYGYPDVMSDYELDHLISLEIGGCPDCVSNLWPEPYNISMGAREKDKVENYLHEEVCKGEITLAEAQNEIATDWTAVYYNKIYGK